MSRPIEENKERVVGILGGGQLARMLVQAAERLGLCAVPFCSSKEDPAAQVSKDFVVGSLQDQEALEDFFSRVEVVVFESDFLPFEVLRSYSSVNFVPALSVLERLSDKLHQKELLQSLHIPSPRFEKFSGGDVKAFVALSLQKFGGSAVFKWARGGYDGKGVLVCLGDQAPAISFCEAAIEKGTSIFAEERISFRRELAQLCVFSTVGQIAFYPLVISEQKNGICERVIGPAVAFGVSETFELKARELSEKIARALQLYGTFAVEMFEDENGGLFVNELAPRVHNSGHFSIDAAECSQFESHWRAILGMPLGSTRTAPAFAMQNLIAPGEAKSGNISQLGISSGAFHFHWYGKSEARAGRKMGHINLVSASANTLRVELKHLDALQREWLSKFERAS